MCHIGFIVLFYSVFEDLQNFRQKSQKKSISQDVSQVCTYVTNPMNSSSLYNNIIFKYSMSVFENLNYLYNFQIQQQCAKKWSLSITSFRLYDFDTMLDIVHFDDVTK